MTSTAARTITELRKKGYIAGNVEKYNTFSHKRNDLFGFIDIVAVHPTKGVLMIQATSGSNVSARIKKIAEDYAQELLLLRLANVSVQVWGWRKTKVKRFGKAVRWTARIVEVIL